MHLFADIFHVLVTVERCSMVVSAVAAPTGPKPPPLRFPEKSEIASPSSEKDGQKLASLNYTQYTISPISFSIDDIEGYGTVKAVNVGNSCGADNLRLDEDEFYEALAKVHPSWIRATRVANSAKTMYPKVHKLASPFSCLYAGGSCKPELRCITKDEALGTGLCGFTVEAKSIPIIAVEEILQYGVFSMLQSFFVTDNETPDVELLRLSQVVPHACGVLSSGPVGFLLAIEWIGMLYYSVLSNPFFLGSDQHKTAINFFEDISKKVRSNKGVCGKENLVTIPFRREHFTNKAANQFLAISTEPITMTFGPFPNQSCFVKVISVVKDTASSSTPTTTKGETYKQCVGEEDKSWPFSAVYFQHMHRVFQVYEGLCQRADKPAILVPTKLLYGVFEVAVISVWVGKVDATPEDMDNRDYMTQLATAVVWLARGGLLYIDLRPPNMRIDRDSGSVWLIDYDDCVLLETPLTAIPEIIDKLEENICGGRCLRAYPVLRECLLALTNTADEAALSSSSSSSAAAANAVAVETPLERLTLTPPPLFPVEK